jgi:DNA-binding NtrC family response regulator
MTQLNTRERTMSKTVAIIDDEGDIRRSCEMILARQGHEIVMSAQDPDILVKAIRTSAETKTATKVAQCDLILMDYHFAGKKMNGLEAAKAIKRLMPRSETVIISGDDSIRGSVIDAGFKFLPKPFSVSTLSSILNGQIGK